MSNTAKMIKVETPRDWPFGIDIGSPVGADDHSVFDGENAVTTVVDVGSPQPTGFGFFNLRPKARGKSRLRLHRETSISGVMGARCFRTCVPIILSHVGLQTGSAKGDNSWE